MANGTRQVYVDAGLCPASIYAAAWSNKLIDRQYKLREARALRNNETSNKLKDNNVNHQVPIHGVMNDMWIEAMSSSVHYAIRSNVDMSRLPPELQQKAKDEVSYFTEAEMRHRGWLDDVPNLLDGLAVDGDEVTIADQNIVIRALSRTPMISPFVAKSTKEVTLADGRVVQLPSHGLSSYGYDIRLGRRFKVFSKAIDGHDNTPSVIDIATETPPTNYVEGDNVILPAGGMILGVSMERIVMPANVLGICMAKSTVARLGIDAKVTPLEPGWEGYITLEIVNHTRNPIRLYAGMGIMQLVFLSGEAPKTTYKDRDGKYMHQPDEPVEARV